VFDCKKVAKQSRKEQGCKRQAIQNLRTSSKRSNRVETPGGCLCANDDIRPVFGRDRWAYDAEERNIKPVGVVVRSGAWWLSVVLLSGVCCVRVRLRRHGGLIRRVVVKRPVDVGAMMHV
jgi:hypothetical protein